MKTIIVTGTLGFIGSNFIRKVVEEYPEYRWVGIDKAVKEYSLDHMFSGVYNGYVFYLGDMGDQLFLDRVFKLENPNIIINFAAESFCDWAETNFDPFINSNICALQVLLNISMKYNVEKVIQISTDECLGEKLNKNDEPWTEEAPLNPKNLYSSSKACSEIILMANHYTHKFKYNITRGSNIFGPRQKKDNLIPRCILSLMNNKPMTIHKDPRGDNFRQYTYVDNKTDAIMKILKDGKDNEIYNIGEPNYLSNIEMVHYLAKLMNKEPKIEYISNRKSHDFGYSLSSDKLKSLGWKPSGTFEENMIKTIKWYQDNKHLYGIK